jgi:plastocyanin
MPNTRIEITVVNGKTAFSPNPVNVPKGDSVSWLNSDTRGDVAGQHQLAPVGGADKAWMEFPVLPGVGGETNIVWFPDAGPVAYRCVVPGHGAESGTINVTG